MELLGREIPSWAEAKLIIIIIRMKCEISDKTQVIFKTLNSEQYSVSWGLASSRLPGIFLFEPQIC